MKKFLFDLFPLILFFAAFRIADDIFIATAVAIAATVAQFVWLKLTGKALEATHWINLGVIVVFGGATLYFQNELFIKWKPTVLYWLFAVILAGARWILRRNIMQTIMGRQIAMPAAVWDKLNYSWAAFFLLAGALNLYVAFSGQYSESQWVNFKVFGLMGLLIAFVIGQSVWLGRHITAGTDTPAPREPIDSKD